MVIVSKTLCLVFGIYLRVAEHMDVYIRTHLITMVLSFVQLLMKRITPDRYQERWALERGEGLKLTALNSPPPLHFLWTKISGTVTNP